MQCFCMKMFRRAFRVKRLLMLTCAAALAAVADCSAERLVPHEATVLDELMPQPMKVEAAATGETPVVPVAALRNDQAFLIGYRILKTLRRRYCHPSQ